MAETPSSGQGFSIPEAAERLSISRASIYRLIESGQLRRVKIGRRSVIPSSEIERLLEDGADVPTPAA